MTYKPIDYSRYRVAEAIVSLFRAGESAESIADDYNLPDAYYVELIVAAYDRRGKHYPTEGGTESEVHPDSPHASRRSIPSIS